MPIATASAFPRRRQSASAQNPSLTMQPHPVVRSRRHSTPCRPRAGGWCRLLLLLTWLATLPAFALVSGTKTALVMLVNLTDASIDCSVSDVQGFFFTNSPLNVDSYFDHSTWGNVHWSGNVVAVSVNFPKSPCAQDNWAAA